MAVSRNLIVLLCMAVSVVMFAFAVAVLIVQLVAHKEKSFGRKIYASAVFLILSVWTLRFSVGYYGILSFENELGISLTWLEEIGNSFIHALQTFSMDEDYTKYITQGKEFFVQIGSAKLGAIYGLYVSLLNILAPIAGAR